MRNRISCSAEALTQLDPDMVQSVVGRQVFQLGNRYYTENRVRILEGNHRQVSAEVNGTFGVYSQTIKLRGGTLSAKCSCPSTEQPFCRHCVAVLLQYFQEQANTSPESSSVVKTKDDVVESPSPSTSSDFNFREVTIFLDWLQMAIPSLGKNKTLPPNPSLPAGNVRNWAETLGNLHHRFLQTEEDLAGANADRQSTGERLITLTEELEVSRREAKDAQGTCVDLRKEIERYQQSLADFSKVEKERDRLLEQAMETAEVLGKKCAELDSVSLSVKSVSKSIQGLLPPAKALKTSASPKNLLVERDMSSM